MLALEVAEKHDQILRLKAEVNQLEENLRQANMQTHFKDDVIKELRRDCRNLMVRGDCTPKFFFIIKWDISFRTPIQQMPRDPSLSA